MIVARDAVKAGTVSIFFIEYDSKCRSLKLLILYKTKDKSYTKLLISLRSYPPIKLVNLLLLIKCVGIFVNSPMNLT